MRKNKTQKQLKKIFIIPIFTAVFGLGFFAFSSQAQAGTYYVSTTGDNTNPGSEALPFKTIQKAADIVQAGDTVYVRAGTYAGFSMTNKSGTSGAWIIFKPYPGESVAIDSYQSGLPHTIWLKKDTKYIEINGFRITDSNSAYDSALFAQYSLGDGHTAITLEWNNSDICKSPDSVIRANCISPSYIKIINNTIYHTGSSAILDFPPSHHNEIINNHFYDTGLSKHGYGMYIQGDNYIIRDNTVTNGYGGGIQLDTSYSGWGGPSNNLVEKNLIYSNGHGDYGKGYWDNDCQCALPGKDRGFGIYGSGGGTGNIIQNNVVYDSYSWGIRISGMTNTKIYNNTVYASRYQALNTQDSYGTTSKNNILYGSLGLGGYPGDAAFDGSAETQSHNLIGIDPDFVNAAGHNFKLNSNSRAIDAGVTLAEVNTDFDGNSRPLGNGHDIGAYEYIASVASSPDVDGSGGVNIKDIQACIKVITGTDTRYQDQCKVLAAPAENTNIKDIQEIIKVIIAP